MIEFKIANSGPDPDLDPAMICDYRGHVIHGSYICMYGYRCISIRMHHIHMDPSDNMHVMHAGATLLKASRLQGRLIVLYL